MKINVGFSSNNKTMSPGFSNSIPAADGGTHVTIDGVVQDKLAIDEYVGAEIDAAKEEINDDINNAIDEAKKEINDDINNAVDEAKKEINDDINNAVDEAKKEISSDIKDAVDTAKEEINGNIKDAVDTVKEEINDNIDNIVDDIEEQLIDTKSEVDAIPRVLKNGLSENSLQQPEAFAGAKGYYWTNIDLVNKKIYLSETRSVPALGEGVINTSFKTPAYEAGNRICIVNGGKLDHGANGIDATVVSVENNVLTYTGNIGITDIWTTTDELDIDDYTLFVIEHPEVGVVDVRMGAIALGRGSHALGTYATAEGKNAVAVGNYSHAEGRDTTAYYIAHAEGYKTVAAGQVAHAEGYKTKAIGTHAHAEGDETTAEGYNSHAEGAGSKAVGAGAHAEGYWTQAIGDYSHSEGYSTMASGAYSHAQGNLTKAIGESSNSQGHNTKAEGVRSSVGGINSNVYGADSFGFGSNVHVHGNRAFGLGEGLIVTKDRQSVFGQYNIKDVDKRYMHILGCGWGETSRINIHTVDESGNSWYKGNLYVGGTSQDDAEKVATKKDVTTAINELKGSAPEVYNTLEKISVELAKDNTTEGAILQQLADFDTSLNGKVRTNNIFDISKALGADEASGTITCISTGARFEYIGMLKDICPDMVAGKTYTFVAKANGFDAQMALADTHGLSASCPFTFVPTEADIAGKIFLSEKGGSEQGTTLVFSNIMINEGSEALPYEPYYKVGTNLRVDSLEANLDKLETKIDEEIAKIDTSLNGQNRTKNLLNISSFTTIGDGSVGRAFFYEGAPSQVCPELVAGKTYVFNAASNHEGVALEFDFGDLHYAGEPFSPTEEELNASFVRVSARSWAESGVEFEEEFSFWDFMINEGTEVLPYEPYYKLGTNIRVDNLEKQLGSLDTALDQILALQAYYTGATFDELHTYAERVIAGGEA